MNKKDFIKLNENGDMKNRVEINNIKEVLVNDEVIQLFVSELDELLNNRALYYKIINEEDLFECRIATKLEDELGKRNKMLIRLTDSSYYIYFERYHKENGNNIKINTTLSMITNSNNNQVFRTNQVENTIYNPLKKVLSFKKKKEQEDDNALIGAKNNLIREEMRNM